MNKEDICFMPAWEMAEKIKTQELTSQEITEVLIERIEKLNPIINAYCTPTFDLAREMAKSADDRVRKNEKIQPLNGIPTSIKDLEEVKGVRTTYGSKIFENYIPNKDAVVVKRLKGAGCVILGKTNTPEFGFKGVTDNKIFGATKNPWNIEMTPGGSSGGAAAASASGLSPLAQGSDGGGSIRIPSSFSGVYGIKPSFGRIPTGSMKKSGVTGTLTCKGPISRNVRDAALMLDVMVGEDDIDRYSLPKPPFSFLEKLTDDIKHLKIGYSMDLGFVEALDSEVQKTVLNAVFKFEKLDWLVENNKKIKITDAKRVLQTYWFAGYNQPEGNISQAITKTDRKIQKMVQLASKFTVNDVKWADLHRERIYEEICNHFKNYDILVTPTLACTAFELGSDWALNIDGKDVSKQPLAWQHYTYPFNLSGHPAASIPCGWSNDGLPIGMQIVGKRLDDLTVLQVSQAFEEIAPWQDRKPNFN
jgi:Asp-tRNA(Asn)/Glu-tRNA(Gln) amidotransferase A subunit family amidase